ncbi:MAG: hypothetical protein IJQ25_04510 [Oscillibacter sp.]|nr:hypothetical protein [Oscillibacter sp.]
MTPHDKAVKALKESGYYSKRQKKHELWYNPELNRAIPLKTHDFDDDDLRYILKEIKRNKQMGRA